MKTQVGVSRPRGKKMRRWVVPVPEEDWAGGARKNPPESLGQFGESSIEAERPLQKLFHWRGAEVTLVWMGLVVSKGWGYW